MIENYPLYWPEGWKRTHSYRRGKSFFKKTTGVVQDLLKKEIYLLGGSSLVVSTNVPTRQDGRFYASAREPQDPGVAVYFNYKKRPMCFACDQYVTVRENLQAIAKTINAIRGIERWGASDMMERAFKGFAALPQADWRRTLEINGSATLDEVESKFRELAHRFHPDKGGNAAMFNEIVKAREQARRELGAG